MRLNKMISEGLEQNIHSYLKANTGASLIELADKFNMAPKAIKKHLDSLHLKGYAIDVHEGTEGRYFLNREPYPAGKINIHDYYGDHVKFGIVSDTHLGSYYERLAALNAMYDIFEKEGVKKVYLPGNITDGERCYPGHQFEVYATGFTKQLENVVAKFPKRKGIKTYQITAQDHEGRYFTREGLDMGKLIEKERSDIVNLGQIEADVKINGAKLRLFHPGGGSAYAISYKPQKIIESYIGGTKPNILIVGHFHKQGYFFTRNVHAILAGCFQEQTSFAKKHHLEFHIGGWIIDANIHKGEVNRLKAEFVPFYK